MPLYDAAQPSGDRLGKIRHWSAGSNAVYSNFRTSVFALWKQAILLKN